MAKRRTTLFDGEKPRSVGHHRSSRSAVRCGVLCSMTMAAGAAVRKGSKEPCSLSKSESGTREFLAEFRSRDLLLPIWATACVHNASCACTPSDASLPRVFYVGKSSGTG